MWVWVWEQLTCRMVLPLFFHPKGGDVLFCLSCLHRHKFQAGKPYSRVLLPAPLPSRAPIRLAPRRTGNKRYKGNTVLFVILRKKKVQTSVPVKLSRVKRRAGYSSKSTTSRGVSWIDSWDSEQRTASNERRGDTAWRNARNERSLRKRAYEFSNSPGNFFVSL